MVLKLGQVTNLNVIIHVVVWWLRFKTRRASSLLNFGMAYSMPVNMAASSSQAVLKWHRFYRFPLPKVHNSHTRNVRQQKLVMRL